MSLVPLTEPLTYRLSCILHGQSQHDREIRSMWCLKGLNILQIGTKLQEHFKAGLQQRNVSTAKSQSESFWWRRLCLRKIFHSHELKANFYKHSLGMKIQLKISDVPVLAKTVPLSSKKKRGGPQTKTNKKANTIHDLEINTCDNDFLAHFCFFFFALEISEFFFFVGETSSFLTHFFYYQNHFFLC